MPRVAIYINAPQPCTTASFPRKPSKPACREYCLARQLTILAVYTDLPSSDAATTRRLWFLLAQRYGWLDDEQNGTQKRPHNSFGCNR